jgi:peptidyl-prolyl cis-trans isomerase C
VPAQLPDVLATVNGERVERWELENAIRGVEAVHGGTPMPADQRDGILRGLLDQIIAYHLIGQEASARKMAPTPAEVSAKVAEMRGQYPDEGTFQKALKNMGVTLEQVQRQTRLGIAVEKMISAEVTSKVSVSDGDVTAFYQQNLDRFKQGEAVHASHILKIAGADADPSAKQKAREEAKQILQQLQKGADFATLAREQSQDSGTAASGGDLGFFPKGQTDPAFEAAAFALKPGGLSDVVESAFGFHIIKVHERRGPRTEPFAEVSGQIKEFLAGQQHAARLGEFVDRVKAKSKIEILV